jgi:RimJ/RimL family protein N-acetyltransferase
MEPAMSIYLKAFKKGDQEFSMIEPLASFEEWDDEFAQAVEDSNLAVTGIKNGEVIGCAGCHPIDEYTGEVWIRLSEECAGFKIEMIRLLKDGLRLMEETYPFETLRATVKCGFNKSTSMIERFGFEFDSEIEEGGSMWRTYTKRTKHANCLTA